MNHKDSKRLSQAVDQYLLQRIEQGYPDTYVNTQCKILQHFCLFVERQPKEWDEIFTLEILKEFMQQGNSNERRRAVRGLSKFLYQQKQISRPIPLKSRQKLPGIFEDYLHYSAPDSDRRPRELAGYVVPFFLYHNGQWRNNADSPQKCPVVFVLI
ncbi:MAG: hypothetical protein KJ985_15520, partial [Proteobacteria bacterium]|nr:hypothetical protein [Pseudomonadota bacterium]